MSEKINQECSSMTANDIADKLETEDCCTLDMEAVADMLRQQQAEIEALKQQLNPPKSTNLGPWQWK